MKYNVSKVALLCALAVGMLTACDKDEDRIVIAAQGEATFTATPSTNIVISEETLASEVLTATWSKANFGYDKMIVDYDLVITTKDTEGQSKSFTHTLGSNVTSKAFTGRELNDLLTEHLAATPGIKTTYDLTLYAYPRSSGKDKPSGTSRIVYKTQSLEITTAVVENKSPDYFLVGNMFGAPEWKNDHTGFPLFLDTPDGKEYTYTGRFAAGSEFKIMGEASIGDWGGILGTTGSGVLSTSGGNITEAKNGGYFTLSVDAKTQTYKMEPFDASAAPTFKSIGLIGTSVGGWDADKVTLTQSAYDPHIWTASGVAIQEGELKFRSNASWDSKSWGGTLFPVAVSDTGSNLKISAKQAGTYNVVFSSLTGHYHFRLAK